MFICRIRNSKTFILLLRYSTHVNFFSLFSSLSLFMQKWWMYEMNLLCVSVWFVPSSSLLGFRCLLSPQQLYNLTHTDTSSPSLFISFSAFDRVRWYLISAKMVIPVLMLLSLSLYPFSDSLICSSAGKSIERKKRSDRGSSVESGPQRRSSCCWGFPLTLIFSPSSVL